MELDLFIPMKEMNPALGASLLLWPSVPALDDFVESPGETSPADGPFNMTERDAEIGMLNLLSRISVP